MKNIFTLLYLVLFSSTLPLACASQDNDNVPKAVNESFQKKYPGENDPDWEIDRNGNYEAHFKKQGIKYNVDFSPEGQWIETETKVDKKDLPEAIQAVIKDKYEDIKIVEIELVLHHSKGTFYDVEFKKDGDKFDVEFDTMGQIIN